MRWPYTAQLNRIEALLAALTAKDLKNMSQITDWAATEQADLTAIKGTLTSIVTGVTALDALISQLQTEGLPPSDVAALAAVKAASAALVIQAAAISVAPPAVVPPVPPVNPPTS